jgi:hypothetical protein
LPLATWLAKGTFLLPTYYAESTTPIQTRIHLLRSRMATMESYNPHAWVLPHRPKKQRPVKQSEKVQHAAESRKEIAAKTKSIGSKLSNLALILRRKSTKAVQFRFEDLPDELQLYILSIFFRCFALSKAAIIPFVAEIFLSNDLLTWFLNLGFAIPPRTCHIMEGKIENRYQSYKRRNPHYLAVKGRQIPLSLVCRKWQSMVNE